MRPQATHFAEIFDLGLWSEWFAQLDRGFIFLLLLPFVVALIGLWAWFNEEDVRRRRARDLLEEKRKPGSKEPDPLQHAHRK
jgi:hypothetical protein